MLPLSGHHKVLAHLKTIESCIAWWGTACTVLIVKCGNPAVLLAPFVQEGLAAECIWYKLTLVVALVPHSLPS